MEAELQTSTWFTRDPLVCQTWLHAAISACSPEHSLTCCLSVYIPPAQVKKKKKKLEKNLITWLTECSGSMSCGCELGWKRNIHKLKLSINSLTAWDTPLWMSERNSLLDENIAVYLLDQVFPGIWHSIRGREGGIRMWSPSGCAEHL